MGVTLLRGRVAVRPIEPTRIGSILLPDSSYDNLRLEDRSLGKLAQSSHRGIVLDVGPPAKMPWGSELPTGFKPGDEVVYVFGASGTEESRRGEYNGEPCVWLAQEEIHAVLE